MEVLVFKTNVRYKKDVTELGNRLGQFADINRWNFDLQDCDRILRIEAADISPRVIENTLTQAGYLCEELHD